MNGPRVGLLPLYLELYDRTAPDRREAVERFAGVVARALESRGLIVSAAPACRLRPEFEAAMAGFSRSGVEALVTLHLAYSPSLESAALLAASRLPLVICNTTPDYDFGPGAESGRIMFNHGIHGVQDLCSVLRRAGCPFHLESGHWEQSDLLDRVAGWCRAAAPAAAFRRARVGRFGAPFAGMGDFQVDPEAMRQELGVETVVFDRAGGPLDLPPETDSGVEAELARDRAMFDCAAVSEESHRLAVRSGLALRRWLKERALTAFTFNFENFAAETGLPTVPFLEAGKAMARGLGYAGEGDTLTAALVGALAPRLPVSFTEMFCPDWRGGAVFLSHMGEINPALAEGKPRLVEKEFPYARCRPPVIAAGRFRGGPATLVNLAPGAAGSFTLIIAPGEVIAASEAPDRMPGTVRGWIRPRRPLAEFLTAYSKLGGTHHLALAGGERSDLLARFGRIMGWRVEEI